jgi:tetratricopeptide (TPR) repeat protein
LEYYTRVLSVIVFKRLLLLLHTKLYRFLAFSGLCLILAACSVKKNTGSSRFYNSLTARYNIFFNGYESYKAGLNRINKGYIDDYAGMLRVFECSDPSTVSMCSSDMERAIQKASKLITLKSITAKPKVDDPSKISEADKEFLNRKEYNEWVDDGYLLIAKARFYKQEYDDAASVFDYCIAEANDPLIKTEAAIWRARVDSEKKDYAEALRLLSEMDMTAGYPASITSLYYESVADLYIKQKRYAEAIEPLSKATELVSGKRPRYRLTYLLAQLYEHTGDGASATQRYRQVVKLNPPYDVEFNARINIAGVFDLNSGNSAQIKRELEKMLRDSKNKDFKDQIYYALGNIAIKEEKIEDAVQYFTKSVASTTGNQGQKGRSYLALAEYFYDKPDYMKAGKYYDSALVFIDSKNPEYQLLQTKSKSLNTLVSQLTIIQTEDSLQRIAAMSENERNNYIAAIIAKIIKDESEGKMSEYADRSNMGQFYENERRFQGNIQQEGKWYFYNQTALTFGRTEFRRRWGDRKLEDNWRRSNRAKINPSQISPGADETAKKEVDTAAAENNYKKPEFYLKKLPLNDSLLAISNDRIATAYLNAGKAFDENINDQAEATKSLETLIKRFPDSELVPEALYNLYRINKEKNTARAEAARQKLLEKYPASEFAKILSDPTYFEKKIASLKEAENLYHQAYNAYSDEKFTEAMSLCDSGLKKFPTDDLSPKFQLLRAYSVARVSDEKGFRDELNRVIKTWPASIEGKKAAEIISYLNQKTPELKVEEEKVIAAEIYVADTKSNHFFELIITDPAFNINLATFDVISYNIDNYTNKNYRTEGILVDNKYIMITVSGFSDYTQAQEYYKGFNISRIVRNATPAMIKFLINENNLKALNKDKNPGRYELFFKENYLK